MAAIPATKSVPDAAINAVSLANQSFGQIAKRLGVSVGRVMPANLTRPEQVSAAWLAEAVGSQPQISAEDPKGYLEAVACARFANGNGVYALLEPRGKGSIGSNDLIKVLGEARRRGIHLFGRSRGKEIETNLNGLQTDPLNGAPLHGCVIKSLEVVAGWIDIEGTASRYGFCITILNGNPTVSSFWKPTVEELG